MAKVKFTFDMYEDNEELQLFQKSRDMNDALWDIFHLCRDKLKYQEPSEETSEVLETIKNRIHDVGIV